MKGLKQAGETCEGRWREEKGLLHKMGVFITFLRQVVSVAQVWRQIRHPVLVGIFFFHGWVKLLPLGHPINHLESKEEN